MMDTLFDTPGTYEPTPREVGPRERKLGFEPRRPSRHIGERRTAPSRVTALGAVTVLLVALPSTASEAHWLRSGVAGAQAASGGGPGRTATSGGVRVGAASVDTLSPGSGKDREALESLTRALARHDESRAAIRHILGGFDELLSRGRVADCDDVLTRLSVRDLSPRQLLAVLTATLPAKDRLQERRKVFEMIEERLARERPTDARALLLGLD